jgi:hypothetical protein
MTTYNLTPGAGSVPPVPTTQPTNLFRFGEQSIWSTQLLAAGTNIANSNLRLFSTPQSQTGQGFGALSIAETNLKLGGMVPQGVGYDVYGVATQVVMNTGVAVSNIGQATNTQVLIDQLLNIVHNGVLTWDFTQSQIDICPIALAGGGGGTYGALAGAGGGAANVFLGNMNNGNGGIWRYMTHPVTLPGQSVFAVLLRFGALAAAVDAANGAVVRVILIGKYKNVIEIG